ncbi:MAG: NAD-dependent epimerase/dehydratase family protein [Burkholderiaceae bacterium]
MKVLLTGASGGVATMIRPLLRSIYSELVLSDREPPADVQPGETFIPAQLDNLDEVAAIMGGVDGLIHLGGQSVEATWPTVLESNICGLYNVYEAARLAGVSRIVFASSNHAVGFYPREQIIDHTVPVKPDTRYGVSKAFGEAMSALYAHKHGLKITDIRIGNVGYEPLDRRRLSIWLHPEDLVQLIQIALEHPDIEHETLYGASDNARGWWDNRRAEQLGYKPKHQSEPFAAAILARNEAPDAVADQYQGGTFCADEYTNRS